MTPSPFSCRVHGRRMAVYGSDSPCETSAGARAIRVVSRASARHVEGLSMRVGLVRHFPVNHPMPAGWMTAAELHRWRYRYDAGSVITLPIDRRDVDWRRCLSSDLERASATAQAFFAGPVMKTPLLREPELAEFQTGRLRLPHWAWRWVLRVAWMTRHRSQRNARADFLQRVRTVADALAVEEGDTLVVSHAGMMLFLRRELLRRGFTGPRFAVAEHGRLYVFEREARRPDERPTRVGG